MGKWLGGLFATIISGVAIYWLTHGFPSGGGTTGGGGEVDPVGGTTETALLVGSSAAPFS